VAVRLGGLVVTRVKWPGRAGDLERSNKLDDLVDELGDNYASYHEFLRRKLADLGPRPDPRKYANDPDGYFDLCGLRQEIVLAEEILRRCRGYRKDRRTLGARSDSEPTMLDSRQRLISVEDPSDAAKRDPAGAEPGWTPPGMVPPGG
jgi:hypothetical protein